MSSPLQSYYDRLKEIAEESEEEACSPRPRKPVAASAPAAPAAARPAAADDVASAGAATVAQHAGQRAAATAAEDAAPQQAKPQEPAAAEAAGGSGTSVPSRSPVREAAHWRGKSADAARQIPDAPAADAAEPAAKMAAATAGGAVQSGGSPWSLVGLMLFKRSVIVADTSVLRSLPVASEGADARMCRYAHGLQKRPAV